MGDLFPQVQRFERGLRQGMPARCRPVNSATARCIGPRRLTLAACDEVLRANETFSRDSRIRDYSVPAPCWLCEPDT